MDLLSCSYIPILCVIQSGTEQIHQDQGAIFKSSLLKPPNFLPTFISHKSFLDQTRALKKVNVDSMHKPKSL